MSPFTKISPICGNVFTKAIALSNHRTECILNSLNKNRKIVFFTQLSCLHTWISALTQVFKGAFVNIFSKMFAMLSRNIFTTIDIWTTALALPMTLKHWRKPHTWKSRWSVYGDCTFYTIRATKCFFEVSHQMMRKYQHWEVWYLWIFEDSIRSVSLWKGIVRP